MGLGFYESHFLIKSYFLKFFNFYKKSSMKHSIVLVVIENIKKEGNKKILLFLWNYTVFPLCFALALTSLKFENAGHSQIVIFM